MNSTKILPFIFSYLERYPGVCDLYHSIIGLKHGTPPSDDGDRVPCFPWGGGVDLVVVSAVLKRDGISPSRPIECIHQAVDITITARRTRVWYYVVYDGARVVRMESIETYRGEQQEISCFPHGRVEDSSSLD